MNKCLHSSNIDCRRTNCSTCEVYEIYCQGRHDERRKVIEVLDYALDQGEGISLLTQYLVECELLDKR